MNTELRVAVCTNRRPDAVAESLGALQQEVPDGRLALVLSGVQETGYNAPVVLVEPVAGLSRARNRALEWAADADVIAFVDDDAVIEKGWYSALSAQWDAAPPSVACIGGPIRPRFSVPPPPWFSDGIAHVLTLLDRGAEVRDLDPDVEAVYGANVSFRVSPLREAGGFDPALGHSGERVFFGEEDAVQRELAARGYRVRYVPDAGVEHVIPASRLTRGSFLKRRCAFGRALGLRGGRPRGLAARQALASGAGALAATATGDAALAMERAVRAAENVGVLTAPSAARPPRGP
jgi:cellulose synthase/poly-beta-1,6-N-acetylglucosamine synthase-like glycosyltransferase